MSIFGKIKSWFTHEQYRREINELKLVCDWLGKQHNLQNDRINRLENEMYKKVSDLERIDLFNKDACSQNNESVEEQLLILKEQMRQVYLKFGQTPQEFSKANFRKPREFNFEKRQ